MISTWSVIITDADGEFGWVITSNRKLWDAIAHSYLVAKERWKDPVARSGSGQAIAIYYRLVSNC